jgi:hypothetical protein
MFSIQHVPGVIVYSLQHRHSFITFLLASKKAGEEISGVIVHSLQHFLTLLLTSKNIGEEITILHKFLFGVAIVTSIHPLQYGNTIFVHEIIIQ